ncbi:MAG: amino acid permease, partial [Actinomycetota bacterium]
LVVYAAVAVSALLAVGPDVLAEAEAPLAAAVGAGSLGWLTPAVRIGATVASLGVLLSLLAGVGRTAFAMAAGSDLPGWLAAIHPARRIPHRAGIAAGALVAVVALVADVRGVIGFSSFAVLVYYALANASAWALAREHRRGAWVPAAGVAGCLLLAFTLPLSSVVTGTAVFAAGALVRVLRTRSTRPSAGGPGRRDPG